MHKCDYCKKELEPNKEAYLFKMYGLLKWYCCEECQTKDINESKKVVLYTEQGKFKNID